MGIGVIAMGGNMGDIYSTFVHARRDLAALPGSRLIESAAIYKSRAIGPPQPDYLNTVLMFEFDMKPLALLQQIQETEIRYGRVRSRHWGPRTLDLDLIAFDTILMHSDNLILPHPRMHERIFVLQCMCEIWPDWQHPHLEQSARELLNNLLVSGEPLLTKKVLWPLAPEI